MSQSERRRDVESISLRALGGTGDCLLPYESYALAIDAIAIIAFAALAARQRPRRRDEDIRPRLARRLPKGDHELG
ncbi:hypothetical protein BJS_09028 [Bradyrhizobium japonicum SEMIA 5079]|nr:hypothetical protein BJS_09028 [Bradyrhizobium japonicum SEMIA 5079]